MKDVKTQEEVQMVVLDPLEKEVQTLSDELLSVPDANLNEREALALARYAKAVDANPRRGELYAVKIRGKWVVIEGYKLLARWAKRQCPYTDKYVEWDNDKKKSQGLAPNDIAYTCHILREDQHPTLKLFVKELDVKFEDAYEHVAFSASGVVKYDETYKTHDKGGRKLDTPKPVDPPKGWTWNDVAKKRGLKNALNLSHGLPSPMELAKESWMVEEMETIAEDWSPELSGPVAERAALLSAQNRQFQQESEEFKTTHTPEEVRERQEERVQIMRGDDAVANDFTAPEEVEVLATTLSPEIEEFRELMLKYGLPDTDSRNKVARWLYGLAIAAIETEDEELRRWNLVEYLRRATILNQEKDEDGKVILFKDKLAQIPEFTKKLLKDVQLNDINDAKKLLKSTVITLTNNNKRLVALDVADDQ
jgi:hypothetical protein